MLKGLKKFLNKSSHLFGRGRRGIYEVEKEWKNMLNELSTSSKNISDNFGKLKVSVAGEKSRIGQMDGWEFTKGMRRGKTIENFEKAAGTTVPANARGAFNEMERVAKNEFPDTMVDLRDTYVSKNREDLIDRGSVGGADKVKTADELENVVEKDPELKSKVQKLNKRKILKYLGGTVVVGGVIYGIYKLCERYAKENTGCFMYRNGNEKVVTCKVDGCSCNSFETSSTKCLESLLPDDMKKANSACDSGRTDEYCVHCDWNETDPESINYIEKSKLPDDCMIVCQKMDALDWLLEFIGGTLEDSWNKGREIIGGLSDSITQVMQYLPIVFFGVIGLIGLVIVLNVIKVFTSNRGRSGTEGDGKTGGRISSIFD